MRYLCCTSIYAHLPLYYTHTYTPICLPTHIHLHTSTYAHLLPLPTYTPTCLPTGGVAVEPSGQGSSSGPAEAAGAGVRGQGGGVQAAQEETTTTNAAENGGRGPVK